MSHLTFVEASDFEKVEKFWQGNDGIIYWRHEGNEGCIKEGFKRNIINEDGSLTEIDVWQTLLAKEQSGEIFIQRLTQEDKDSIAQQEQVDQFKASRQQLLDSAVVTTSNGNKYDADEQSISRMANAILAAQRKDLTNIQWSLADTPTGVMTDVTLADLEEAHELAVENMASIWSIN
jgi:hypothetical protein